MERTVDRPKSTGVNESVTMAPPGAKVIGVLSLVQSIYMIMMHFAVPDMEDQWEQQLCKFSRKFNFADDPSSANLWTIATIMTLAIGGLRISMSAMLLAGIAKKSSGLMMPFLIWDILCVVFLILGLILSFIIYQPISSGLVCMISILFAIGLYSYCIFVVRKHRREIMNSNRLPLLPITEETSSYQSRSRGGASTGAVEMKNSTQLYTKIQSQQP